MRPTVFIHSSEPISSPVCWQLERDITETLSVWSGKPVFFFLVCKKMPREMTIHVQILNLAVITTASKSVRQSLTAQVVDDINDYFPRAYVQCNTEPFPNETRHQAVAESNPHRRKNRIKATRGKERF